MLCAAPRSDRMHPDNLPDDCQFDRLVLSLACDPELDLGVCRPTHLFDRLIGGGPCTGSSSICVMMSLVSSIGRTVTCKPDKYRERSGDRIILRDKSPFLKDKPPPSKRPASIWAIREAST